MSRPHDLGGRPGLGRVPRGERDNVFEHDWERKVFGLTFATLAQGVYNTDENRYARESMEPDGYRNSRYYEFWFAALETNLVDKGVASFAELERRESAIAEGLGVDTAGDGPPDLISDVRGAIFGGVSPARPARTEPAYRVGDRVRVRAPASSGHTRLPGYIARKIGVVVRVCGAFVLPDSNAHLEGEQAQHVYTVEFAAREVWSDSAEPNAVIRVDAWEQYLEPPDNHRRPA